MRSLYSVALAVLASGCVRTNASILDPSALYQKTCPDAVVVYTNPERVGKPYKEVALLNSKGESGMTSEEGMVKSQSKKAAQVGANGLILGGVDEPKPGTKIIGAILGTGAERKGKALAIYVPDDSLKTATTCGGSEASRSTAATTPKPDAPAAPESATPPVTSTDLPPGTNWIADSRARIYYPVHCSAAGKIAPADRLFYASESSLKAAGFNRSENC
jgi:hypothetical protein